ncbi:MAG: hypothetical protein ABFR36_02200 [Acidobacteriota bacterium]
MKNLINVKLLAVVLIILSFSFSGCNGFGSPEYTLNVILEDGCTGTPEAGTYIINELEQIEYEYFPPSENIVIEVLVNEGSHSDIGSFTMYNNVTLTVRINDIRGNWLFTYFKEDSTEPEMTISFAGDTPFAGTFTDSRGYSGTWTVVGDDFTMTYSDWADYVFTGFISSMSGSYIGEGVSLGWKASRSE